MTSSIPTGSLDVVLCESLAADALPLQKGRHCIQYFNLVGQICHPHTGTSCAIHMLPRQRNIRDVESQQSPKSALQHSKCPLNYLLTLAVCLVEKLLLSGKISTITKWSDQPF